MSVVLEKQFSYIKRKNNQINNRYVMYDLTESESEEMDQRCRSQENQETQLLRVFMSEFFGDTCVVGSETVDEVATEWNME